MGAVVHAPGEMSRGQARNLVSYWSRLPVADSRQKRFLDGDSAAVSTDDSGMTFDATNGYAVLWTKEIFEGDVRIEYDFRRLDSYNRGVNIIYIQAIGDGEERHAEDITKWSEARSDAAMSDYFNNMHAYHISYAAFDLRQGFEYVRARRYMPLAGPAPRRHSAGR